jgi:hypothetical protein
MKSTQTIKEVLDKNSIQLSADLLEEFFSFYDNKYARSYFDIFVKLKATTRIRAQEKTLDEYLFEGKQND